MNFVFAIAIAFVSPLWPSLEKMPNRRPNQIAAPSLEARQPGFDRDAHRMPYLEWSEKPANANGACVVIIPGGGYVETSGSISFRPIERQLLDAGYTCAWLWYRTPRPSGLPIHQSAWEDGQRAIRIVRSAATERGYDPEKIGVVGCSAGSHLAVLLASSALTPAYGRIDEIDDLPCHVNWAIPICPAFALTDGLADMNSRDGDSPDVALDPLFRFDEKTAPMCLFHGGKDRFSPNGSTQLYRQLRRKRVPAELHLTADLGHGLFGKEERFSHALGFMRQMNYDGRLGDEVALLDRYAKDNARAIHEKKPVWPEGKTPDVQTNQCLPYIEWHIPAKLSTRAIQIVYSGGCYTDNSPDGFEVAPFRRYLNEKGVAVVTLKYRTPRPYAGLKKHVSAWQDLQRTIRIVRSEAAGRGLDPNRIGIMGSSAGGHLTLMGATSSLHRSYNDIDELDKVSCTPQWAIAIYPAYALTDGLEDCNKTGGNDDSAVPAPEFSFDLATCPILFIHGDSDGWAAMNSVKCWERLRRMGIQGELHTLARRSHCFQRKAAPGTGSYDWMDTIWSFLVRKGYVK